MASAFSGARAPRRSWPTSAYAPKDGSSSCADDLEDLCRGPRELTVTRGALVGELSRKTRPVNCPMRGC